MNRERKKSYFDYSLLFIIIFLLCFGLVMLYSTSSYSGMLKFKSSTYYLYRQIKATGLGLCVMLLCSLINYRFWKKFAFLIYIAALPPILLVLTPIGVEAYGARRWIAIPGLPSIQPAEYAKMAVIIFLAVIISKSSKQAGRFSYIIKIVGLSMPVVLMIVIITKNLSSALIILSIAIVMVFVASPKYSHFVMIGAVGVAGVVSFILLAGGFRLERVRVWLNPEQYPLDGGYQVLQGLYAIGSGGIFGKGLGQSVQKLGFIPEAQNDMIFSIICEELGLVGALAVIIMFAFLIWRFMFIASNAPDLYGSLLVVGIMAHISVQVILNVAVVTNSIPNTGITLPFISYGGSSVVFLLAEMGIALNVSKNIKGT